MGIGVGGGANLDIYDNGPTSRELKNHPNSTCSSAPGDSGTSVGTFAGIGAGLGPYNANYGASAGRHFDGTGGSYFNEPGVNNPIGIFGGSGLSFGGAFGVEVIGW